MFDARPLQARLGVLVDNNPGRGTMTALFSRMGAKQAAAEEYGMAAAVHFRTYGVLESGLRLAHFMGQCALESGDFRYTEEIWGPTQTQRGYEGRTDLGNTQPGDGYLMRGRGPGQLTGRDNYRSFGRELGLDFERHPEIVALPSVGLLAFCAYWNRVGLNAWADRDDGLAVGKGINRGNPKHERPPLHADERAQRTAKAKALIL